ncbi:MAG: DUF3006 domain-containing protein [Bacillota bacterium]|mgnify:FL=1|nr:DUF3006 domain-containing protein [Bacillota bacterium]
MKTVKVMAVLDRCEADTAVLLLGPENKKVLWPREFLPEGSREGQIFTLELVPNRLATELARREVEELLREIVAENKPE